MIEITPENSKAPIFLDDDPQEPSAPPPIPDEDEVSFLSEQRQSAYRVEADPLYFKWQRGEIPQQLWLDQVEEIRQRFPYPDA